MDRDEMLLTLGQVTGMALRMTPAQLELLLRDTPELTPTNLALVEATLRYREELERLMRMEG